MSQCQCGNPDVFESPTESHKIMGEPVIPLKNIGTNLVDYSDDHDSDQIEEFIYIRFDSSKFYYQVLQDLFTTILLTMLVLCMVSRDTM